jgi:hypothetical protein
MMINDQDADQDQDDDMSDDASIDQQATKRARLTVAVFDFSSPSSK